MKKRLKQCVMSQSFRFCMSIIMSICLVVLILPTDYEVSGSMVEEDWLGDYTNTEYLISDFHELRFFANAVNEGHDFSGKTVKLANDIVISGAYTPAGNSRGSTGFRGIFDGAGHTIKWESGAQIQEFGIIGYNLGTIINVTVTGSVTGSAINIVGGIAGYNAGEIKGCSNLSTINILTGDFIGGIAGLNEGTIHNSSNNGSVNGNLGIGGIAGKSANGGIIKESYNAGSVHAQDESAGGIAGLNSVNDGGLIENCFNKGSVAADGRYTAGIAGCNHEGTIRNSYNGTEGLYAGISGHNAYAASKVENCYSVCNPVTGDRKGSLENVYSGGGSGSAEEVRDQLNAWILSNGKTEDLPWCVGTGGYPVLGKQVQVSVESDGVNASLSDASKDWLVKTQFSAGDLEWNGSGKNLGIVLSVKKMDSSDVSASQKELVDKYIADANLGTCDSMYLDIRLIKTGDASVPITSTSPEKLSITFSKTDDSEEYQIIRLGDSAAYLPDMDADSGFYTVETDYFTTFVLLTPKKEPDKEPEEENSGGNNFVYIWPKQTEKDSNDKTEEIQEETQKEENEKETDEEYVMDLELIEEEAEEKEEKTTPSVSTPSPKPSVNKPADKKLDNIPRTGEDTTKNTAAIIGMTALLFYLISKRLNSL